MASMAAGDTAAGATVSASAASISTAALAIAIGSKWFRPAMACVCARSMSAPTTSTDRRSTIKAPIASAVGVFNLIGVNALSLLFVDEGHGIGNAGPRGAIAVGLVVAVRESE